MDSGKRFHDLVGVVQRLNYSMRCRAMVDEVIKQHGSLGDPVDRGAAAWGWLENELDAAAGTPGSMAWLFRAAAAKDATAGGSAADLRAWAWRRLGSPSESPWTRGADSRAMWSFLMSPAPVDDDELWWLASSNGLDEAPIRALMQEVAPESEPAPARG